MANTYCYLVFTNAVAGKEDAFNVWYTEQHLPDVLKVPGIVAARRFRLADVGVRGAAPQHRYLSIYELDTDNPAATLEQLTSRIGTEEMVTSDAIDVEHVSTSMWGVITDRILAAH